MAVGVDVPETFYARGEGLLGGFREVDVGLAERWQGAWEVCVFDRGEVCERVGVVDDVEGGGLAGMADGVLARYDASVCEAGGYVVREVADDGG